MPRPEPNKKGRQGFPRQPHSWCVCPGSGGWRRRNRLQRRVDRRQSVNLRLGDGLAGLHTREQLSDFGAHGRDIGLDRGRYVIEFLGKGLGHFAYLLLQCIKPAVDVPPERACDAVDHALDVVRLGAVGKLRSGDTRSAASRNASAFTLAGVAGN